MHNGDAALKDADACIAIDATNPKGHFRRAQALVVLKNIPESHKAFEEAARLAPNEKLYSKGLRKSQKRLDSYVPDLDPDHTATKKAKPTTPASSIVSSRPVSAPTSTSASTTSSKAKSTTSTAKSEMRGYKIVNGKKTSYFHHEMTEEEKRLIGDITPQKIDPATQTKVEKPAVEGMSEWNSKGTFEDRNVLPWAKTMLNELIQGQKVVCGNTVIEATKVSDVKGTGHTRPVAFHMRLHSLPFSRSLWYWLCDSTPLD